MKARSKTILSVAIAAAIASWFFVATYRAATQREMGENIASVDWLPSCASNISFFRSYMSTAYEFDISEPEFVAWSRWEVSEITAPITISRYLWLSDPAVEPDPNFTPEELLAYMTAVSQRTATVSAGLYYGRLEDNGGGVWVAFDREAGRAFYKTQRW